jgi:TPP-dependent pyruvate/acetoin dehydrogenase alpha subunit
VFVCQHNQYGEHTRFADFTRTRSLADRFRGYGMEARTVDGNSVPAMDEAAGEAIGRARAGGGPTFLECMTYRLGGHTFGSTTEYMDADEYSRAEADEPVARYRRWLIGDRGIGEGVLHEIEDAAAARVEEAVAAAKAAAPPGADELFTDVFSSRGDLPG